MASNFSKRTKSTFKILGIYQIVGGTIGLGLTISIISRMLTLTISLIFLLLIATGLYLYSVYCGVLLLKGTTAALRHSLINQILQVINFSVFGITFQYISGAFLSIGLNLTNSALFTFYGGVSQWRLAIHDSKEILFLNLNLVALFLIVFIEKLKREIFEEQSKQQIQAIGK